MTTNNKVIIIPCSGIGKAYGTVGREAAYMVVEELRPGVTDTVCLSLLVMGEEEARRRVQENPCITIDGCPLACAQKNVELAGGKQAVNLRVIDTYKEHRDLKPQAVTLIDENGRQLARFLAQQVAAEVDRLTAVGADSVVPNEEVR